MKQIVLNVDQAAMFDLVKRLGDNAESVGSRLASMVLGGGDVGMLEAVGLAVYGITVEAVREADPEAPPEAWAGMAGDEARIVAWIKDRFGADSALDLRERADRLLEEAIEAQQAAYAEVGAKHGYSPGCERAIALVGHVYSKEPGDPRQEMGGVITCALALAHRLGVKLDQAAQAELTRIEGLSKEHFDKRHQAKVDAGVAAQHVRPAAAE